MTDKVQKIKEWISKTQDGLMDAQGNFENPSEEGAFHILSNLDYYIDTLQEEPVKDRFAFKAIPRLLDMIEPTDKAKSYVTKLADAFDSEGYYTDAKIVRESLKIMNGEKVAMATMDEEPVSIWHDAVEATPTKGSNILMIRKNEEDPNYPPIAGCFHGKSYPYDKLHWGYYNGFCYNEIEPPVKWAYINELLKLSGYDR